MGAAGLVLNPKPRNEFPPFLCFSLECAHDSASQEREAERVPSFTHKFDELRFFFFLDFSGFGRFVPRLGYIPAAVMMMNVVHHSGMTTR